MRRTRLLIVGGGPAGAAAAIALAGAGHRPLLLERADAPRDPVCGGFLSADTLAQLAALGIDAAALGAQPIDRLRLVIARCEVSAALPFAAAGLSRRVLDEALLARASALGAIVERGCAVRSIDTNAMQVTLADGSRIAAEAIFLATGKHELRGLRRDPPAGRDLPVGLRVTLADVPLRDWIELFLFDRGYAGLLRQEDGRVNLCLSVAASRLAAAGGSASALTAMLGREVPQLGARLAGACEVSPWSSIARVPYGWIAASAPPGLYRIGDQAAVIASIAGDGIAIALASGRAAAAAWMADRPGFQADFARRARRPVRIASGLRLFAERPGAARLLLPMLGRFPALIATAMRMTRIGGY